MVDSDTRPPSSAVVAAEAWNLLDEVNRAPAEARKRATDLLESGRVDDTTASILWRVVGMALRVERRPAEAIPALGLAVEAAERAQDRRLRGLALLSLALAEAYVGRTAAARRTIDVAVENLRGIERADARFQRALIMQLIGEYDQALADYRAALPAFRRQQRHDWIADLLTNRGILHAYRGNHFQAKRDFETAKAGFVDLGDDLGVASMDHNLAWLATLRGEVVEALSAYGQAEQELLRVGFPVETVAIDHCEALNAAGLFLESAGRAAAAASELTGSGMELAEAETLVVEAEAWAYAGVPARGLPVIHRALELLERHGNTGWLLRARLARLRLQQGAEEPDRDEAQAIAEALEAAGLIGWSREAKLLLAQHLIDRGELEAADQLLGTLPPGRLIPELAVLWWLTKARRHQAAGNGAAAVRAARSGLRAVRERQHAANTSEVRAHIGRRLGSLASVGIRHAIRMNRPADVLVWSNELVETPPPPRQAPDATVRTLTFELRALSHELVREQAGEDPDRRGRLLRRQQAIHRRLRARQERNRHAPGAATAAAVAEARSDTALRVYAVDGDALHVVHNRGGRLELDSLTSVEELLAALRQLDFQLRSFLRSGGGEAKRRRLEWQAVAVDRLLGLPGEGADGEISVFVPPVLGAIALGILPSLCGRPTLQTTMLGAQADRVGIPTGIVAVGGSDLIHATTEAETVGLSYRESTTLTGPAATCQAALRSMEGADVVHFAAHGRRSPDDPFFDAILLADGPLFTHELEWLERAPRIAVLASCESAVDHSLGDSQRLGVMPSLDRVGVWRTIASPYPLPDNDLTVSVMTNLHRRLARTGDPVGALAECAIDPDLADDALIIARSLVCRGRPVAGPDR